MEQWLRVEWILPESEKSEQVRAIELAGGDVEDSGGSYTPAADEWADYPAAGFEPLTMIAVAATVVYVVEALAKTWRERSVRGGTIIDARGDKLRVRRVPAMPNGQLVILETGKQQVFTREQANEGLALLKDLLPKFVQKAAGK
jgi:hypothetical protein